MAVLERPLTLEEFLQLPERKPPFEYEEGPSKLARAFSELRVTFGGRSYVPDVSVFRWDRIPCDPDGRVADDFFEPPDLVVEIVSPKQSVNALVRCCLWFTENGVPAPLLVDPADESILRFTPGAPPEVLRGENSIELGSLFPGAQLKVADLFESLYQR